jgi:hypothetical protein
MEHLSVTHMHPVTTMASPHLAGWDESIEHGAASLLRTSILADSCSAIYQGSCGACQRQLLPLQVTLQTGADSI